MRVITLKLSKRQKEDNLLSFDFTILFIFLKIMKFLDIK